MSRLISRFSMPTCLLVVALVFICASTVLAQPPSAPKTMTWALSNGTVVDPGTTTGNITTGYKVEATAQAQGRAKVATGKFTINCTIQQQADGTYKLQGAWDITREGAAKAAHHTPGSIKGTLSANLTAWPGPIDGQVLVTPMRRHAGKAAKAQGTFKANENFDGTLSITSSR